jgi:hypothetical protein
MEEPIEEAYFNWLCAKVLQPYNLNHKELLRILYSTEFTWIIPGDRNRAEDGVELREDFLHAAFIRNDPEWRSLPCSVLEMFFSFANRASFQTDIEPQVWFWVFMSNLGLDEYRRVTGSDRYEIEEILYNFIWRTYSSDGTGGMFPLRNPLRNQKEIEIWFQFCDYLEDQGLLYA